MPRPRLVPSDRRAILLARVSSAEQAHGFSLDAQLRLLRDYAERLGLEVVEEHRIAETASTATARRVFAGILRTLLKRGAPGHLIAEKSDRLERNQRDTVALDDLRLGGLRIHFVKDGLVLGPDSSSSDLLSWEMRALIARHYVRNLGEEVRKGMAEKRRGGGWPHQAPIGLRNVRDEHRRWIEHDPERAPLVRQLAEAVVVRGMTMTEAARHALAIGLTRRGTGRPLAKNDVASLLRSPLLAALVPVEGGWMGARKAAWHGTASSYVRAAWEPVIPPDTWRALQALLDARVRGKGPRGTAAGGVPHALAGLVRCGACGRAATMEIHERRRRRYAYLRCGSGSSSPCGRVYLREADAFEQIGQKLDRLAIDPADLESLRRNLLESEEVEVRELERAKRSARAAQDKAQQRVSRAVRLAIDGSITAGELAAVRADAARTEERTAAQVAALQRAGDRWADDAVRVLGLVQHAGQLYRLAEPTEKRAIVSLMFGDLTLAEGEIRGAFVRPWATVEAASLNAASDRAGTTSAPSRRKPSRIGPCRPQVEPWRRLLPAALDLRAHPAAVAALLRLAA